MKNLSQLKQNAPSLTERIYKDLRTAIITGEIPGGTRLVESALADQLGVSRTPIREALQRFSQEGLVNSIPRTGYIVEDMSEADVKDLFTIRTAMEKLAAQLALPKFTDVEIKKMKQNLDRTKDIIESGRTEKMIDADIEFHHILYRASRSKRLYQICKSLSDHTFKFRAACIYIPAVAKGAYEEHKKIYEAIKSRNPKTVEDAITSHLNVVQKDILEFVKRVREEQFIAQEL